MPLFAESEDKIFGDVLFDVVNDTNISRSSPGSKTRAVTEAVSKKMGRMWTQFDLNLGQAFLDGAEGKFLNFVGDMMGLGRLGEEAASISSLDRIIKFFVDVGTFGDINGGAPILIDAGTIISTSANGGGIQYQTIVDTILSPLESEAFISAQSVRTGSSANLGSNQLTFHDFTGYVDSINDTLKATNDADIVSAQDIESDTNYRFRIANQVVATENANETAVRLAALSVPGVADLIFIPFSKGIGTFELLIKSTTPRISDGLIAAVQESVSNVAAFGVVPSTRGPLEVGLSMVATITLRKRVSSSEESAILTAVKNNVIDYINNLDIGEEFIVNEVVERVLSTSELIKNVGRANQPIDELFIFRQTKLEDNKIRSKLIEDFQPEVDERIIVETQDFSGTEPIFFRIAT